MEGWERRSARVRMCVWVRVCVCVRVAVERGERERECVCVCACVCVKWEVTNPKKLLCALRVSGARRILRQMCVSPSCNSLISPLLPTPLVGNFTVQSPALAVRFQLFFARTLRTASCTRGNTTAVMATRYRQNSPRSEFRLQV